MNARAKKPKPSALRAVLAANVAALREVKPMGGIRAWGDRIGVGEATVDRILKGSGAVQIDSLEAVANGFDVDPWQILVPELDPRRLPELVDPTKKVPGLSSKQAALLDHIRSMGEPELDALMVLWRLQDHGGRTKSEAA